MKVAITSTGNNKEAHLDSRFGRCAYFAIYDTDNQNLTFVENTAKNAASGAGPAAVSIVAGQGVSKIISGNFGFKIEDMLNNLHIEKVVLAEDKTIAEIISTLN